MAIKIQYKVAVLPPKKISEEKRAKIAFQQQLGQQTDKLSAIEEKIEELFEAFDSNHNGYISLDELKQGLLRWGVKLNKYNVDLLSKSFPGVQNADLNQFSTIMKFFISIRRNFTKYDTDSSNTMNYRELQSFLTGFSFGFRKEFMNEFLKLFDTDKSGELDFQEIVELMLYIKYLQTLFAQEDQSKDGVLDPAELQALLRSLDITVTVPEMQVFVKRAHDKIKGDINFEKFVELLLDIKQNLENIRKETNKERKKNRVPRNVVKQERKFPASPKYEEDLEVHLKYVEDLKNACKTQNRKFEDKDFPPTEASLFPKRKDGLRAVTSWKRMDEFGAEAELFKDGVDAGDVKQGALGDCWFLSSLCVLAGQGTDTLKNLFFKCYPQYGIIQCRFYKDGHWRFIVTDDRIPCGATGKPAFASCRDKNELWVPVLEKCYAKLHGNYEALESGSITDGLVDLTGEASEVLEIAKEQSLWETLKDHLIEGYLLGCAANAPGATVEMETPLGILLLHAYGILSIHEVEGNKLLKIRNPWGRHEWKGRWSDGSKEWTPAIQKKLNVIFEDDGTFYMEFSDFCKHFNKLYVLRILTDDIGKKWNRFDFYSQWKGETAGGCPNFPTWSKNPQYQIRVDEKSKVFVSLRQPDLRLKLREKPKYTKSIGFVVFVKGDVTDDPKIKRVATDLITLSPFFLGREISVEFILQPNIDYVIIPSHFNQNEENEFHLVVYAECSKTLVRQCKSVASASQNQQQPQQSQNPQQQQNRGPTLSTSLNPRANNQQQQQQSGPQSGHTLKVQSAWVNGKNAGGCVNEPTWKESPQFILDVPVDDKVTINLQQLQKPEGKYHHIGFIVMKAEPSKKRKFVTADAVYQTQFMNTQTNSGELDIQAGAYNILACTFKPNCENTFEISVSGNHLQKASLYELTPANDWKKTSLKGAWVQGKCGGCSNHKNTWMQNPLYRLEVPQADLFKIIVDVHDDIKSAAGYYLWATADGNAVGKLIAASNFLQGSKNLSVSKDWQLEPGRYLIMPATFEPNKFGSFTVVVLSEKVNCKITAI